MAEPIAFPYTHDDYNVGWVCALPKELATAIYMLEKRHPDLKQPRRDRSSYTLGRIGEHNIVIAGLPKAGAGNTKTSFATVAVRMINTFPNIKIPLMVGIGSGIPQKVRLGDVVISAPIDNWPGVVQWEIGKVEEADFVQTGSLNPPPRLLPLISLAEQSKLGVDMMAYLDKQIPQEYFLSPQSEDIAYKSSYQHIGGSDCGHCDDNMNNMAMARESQQKHRLHYGLIASGNQVIKSAALRDILYHQFNKSILCIDTEAAELENNFPCIIIRGISDYADSHTNMAWQEYAAAASAACAKAFLNIMPVSDVDKLQAVKSLLPPMTNKNIKNSRLKNWLPRYQEVSSSFTDLKKTKDVGISKYSDSRSYQEQISRETDPNEIRHTDDWRVDPRTPPPKYDERFDKDSIAKLPLADLGFSENDRIKGVFEEISNTMNYSPQSLNRRKSSEIGTFQKNENDNPSKIRAPQSIVTEPGARFASYSVPISDSGYGTIPHSGQYNTQQTPGRSEVPADIVSINNNQEKTTIYHKNENNLADPCVDDGKTVYSDTMSLSGLKIDTYTTALAKRLLEQIDVKELNDQLIHKMLAVLPRLLKALALKFGYEAPSQVRRDMMVFLHKHRDDIAKSFEANCNQTLDSQSEPELSEDQALPLPDKMNMWFNAVDLESSEPSRAYDEDSNEMNIGDLEEELHEMNIQELEELDALNIPEKDYEKLLFSDSGFEWLVSRLRRELLLSQPKHDTMGELNREILHGLPSANYISRSRQTQRTKAIYHISWDPLAFFSAQGYGDSYDLVICDVITLTGSHVDAQALSCREYLAQTWPQIGTQTLRLIQKLLATNHTNKVTCNVLDGLTLWASMVDSKVVIEALGVPDFVAEVGEQVAWLGAALQTSPFPAGVAYCIPFIEKRTLDSDILEDESIQPLRCYIKFKFEKCESADADRSGQCWHDMFKGPVIVRGFPIPQRSKSHTGLEIPLNMMAALARTRYVNIFDSKVYIKGFSTMLVPTKKCNDVIIWHLLHTKRSDDRISYLNCSLEHADVKMAELELNRHVIGWCSEAVAIAGTLAATYSVKKSRLPISRNDVTMDKFEITAGKYITGTATFKLGGKEQPAHISRSGYLTKMKWISSQYFVFWDEGEKRGWLVDGASALLHLLRASLEHGKHTFNSAFLLNSSSLTDTNGPDHAASAKETLINAQNRDLRLYVDKTEVYETEINDGNATRNIMEKITKYYSLEDKIEHIYNTVEKLIEHQLKIEQEKGIRINLRPRRILEGWDFDDLVTDNDPFFRRFCTLHTIGKGWVDFIRGIHAVTLLGRGFGELIQPKTSTALACSHWSRLPANKFYLATHMLDLQNIMDRHGEPTSTPRKLCDNVLWLMRQGTFQVCPCVKDGTAKHHDPVQALFTSKFQSSLENKPLTGLKMGGAVIFGHNSRLHWHFGDSGDPVKGDPEDLIDSLDDSGLGSSIMSPTNIGNSESNSAIFLTRDGFQQEQTSKISASGETAATFIEGPSADSADESQPNRKRHLQEMMSRTRKKMKF